MRFHLGQTLPRKRGGDFCDSLFPLAQVGIPGNSGYSGRDTTWRVWELRVTASVNSM